MNLREVFISQYLAALEMLKETITRCPESIWNSPDDRMKFWNIAYHALFYTHLYLEDSEESFKPWHKHIHEYQFLGQVPWEPHRPPKIGSPYDRETVLEYLAFCQQVVGERITKVNLEAESGFSWLPFTRLELLIYTLRHLQQHTGELMERLGTRTGVELPWVGRM